MLDDDGLSDRTTGTSFTVEDTLSRLLFKVVCFLLDGIILEKISLFDERVYDVLAIEILGSHCPVLNGMVILVGKFFCEIQQRNRAILFLKQNYVISGRKAVLKKLAEEDVYALDEPSREEIFFHENVVCLLNKATCVGEVVIVLFLALGHCVLTVAINYSYHSKAKAFVEMTLEVKHPEITFRIAVRAVELGDGVIICSCPGYQGEPQCGNSESECKSRANHGAG